MTSRNYSANAVAAALTAGVNSSATTIPVSLTTGWPSAPFIIALDYGTSTQEVVLVTAVAGLNLTVTRGYDSTTAQAHSLGAVARPVHSAVDFRDSRTHEAATTGVHGVTGAVVGTTDTQALTGKDLTSGNTFPATLATTAGAQTLTNKTVALGSNTVSGTTAQFNTALSDNDFATLAGAETLTNKTINWGSNTVSMTKAQLNAAVSDADVVTLDGAETLTNKTLTSPIINNPVYGGAGEIRYIEKTVDEPLTTSTTFQDDDALTFSVAANATYEVHWVARFTRTINTCGRKYQFTAPSDVTGSTWTLAALTAGSPIAGNDVAPSAGAPDSADETVTGDMRIKTTTAGTVTFQWAQHTASGTLVCKAGSFIRVVRIA